MNDFETPPSTHDGDNQPATDFGVRAELPRTEAVPPEPTVDSVRSAAGRLGGKRVHQLAELGREYEKEHGLKAGRQRLKQLVQLGRKYEIEHGLRPAEPRRRKKGDGWQEFFTALARVVKPEYRPAIEKLVRPAFEGGSVPGRAA